MKKHARKEPTLEERKKNLSRIAFGLELSGNLVSMIHENMRESELHGNLHGSVQYVPDYGKIVGLQRVSGVMEGKIGNLEGN